MPRYRLLLAVLCAFFYLIALPAHASIDNKGKEFVMAFLPNYGSATLELHLTSDISTTVSVEYPVGTVIATPAVGPGAITIVSIPSGAADWTLGTVQSRVIRASADEEFVCYMVNRVTYTSDAALALPIETFNTEYIVGMYTPRDNGDGEFGVVAGYDNTTVTITPKVALSTGQSAGVAFSVTLDKGEGYVVSGALSGSAGDLTGTIVTSDNPIGMVNGNMCVFIPPGVWACDHVFEVAQPTQTWGNRALVANLPNRSGGSIYRILAAQNGTTVTQNGTSIGTIDRDEFIDVGPTTGAHVFESTQPIYVIQYMTGDENPGAVLGDPAMGNMMPTEQYLASYTFSTVGGGQFVENYVTIIADDDDVGSLTLDGTTIPSSDFTAIGTTGYSWTIKSLTSGTHATVSTNPHGITVEGYNNWDSYLYPGGALFQFINPVGDENPPNCSELTVANYCGRAYATDNRPTEDVNGNDVLDDGEDLNGNGLIDVDAGIFFVELNPAATNLTLTTDVFVPGADSVAYEVCLTDNTIDGSGIVIVTDGAGNICTTAVSIVANRPPVITCLDAPEFAAGADCMASIAPEDLVASVVDPDDDPGDTSWTLTMSPAGPFALGSHTVTVTATDDHGATATCTTTFTVEDATVPELTLAPAAVLLTRNHRMITFSIGDVVSSIADNCSSIAAGEAYITKVTSDEPEDGAGDGNTVDDIVIAADCKSVDLREERAGGGNGRVYQVYVSVEDGAGNVGSAVYNVEIPHSSDGVPAVLDATEYMVTSACGFSGKPAVFSRRNSGSISIESIQPNPFDDATTVTYSITAPGHVSLVVRELTGKPVATLADADMAAGTHTARLEAAGLPVGTYLVTLTLGDATVSQKVTLMR